MIARGWLMTGNGPEAAAGLPPHFSAGIATVVVPNAAEFEPGQWILWSPTAGLPAIVLVCVDVPL